MPDAFEIVANINAFLSSRDPRTANDAEELATAYASMCESTNVRLRRCADYLRRGLRAEAIYHAEVQPDVLELVAALDIVRVDDWNAICAENHLDQAPRLLLEVAREINEAYAAEIPMKDLLRAFRTLSLGRAPLRRRLDVLRSIVRLDPANALLEEDLKSYETARLKEVGPELAEAAKAEDLKTLRELAQEIRPDKWKVAVPPALVKSLLQTARKVQTDKAIRELNALLPSLYDAHGALSYEECCTLLEQWNGIVSENELMLPNDLQEQVQPIMDWASEQRQRRELHSQFTDACLRLEQALDGEVTANELRRLHHHAVSFEQPILEEILTRVARRLEDLDLKQRRRTRAILAAASVGVILLGVGVFYFIERGIANSRAEQWRQQIADLIEKGQLEDARRLLDSVSQQDPQSAAREGIARLSRRLDVAVAAESSRAAQFRGAMEAATQAGIENPDRFALQQARQLARGDQEKAEVAKIEEAIDAFDSQQQAKRDGDFTEKVKAVSMKFGELVSSDIDKDLDSFQRKWNQLDKDVSALRRAENVSRELMEATVVPLEVKLESYRKALSEAIVRRREDEKERAYIANLSRLASSPAQFAKGLSEFAMQHPASPKAKSFKLAAQQLPLWVAVCEWTSLTQAWRNQCSPPTAAEAELRIAAIKDYLAKQAASPLGLDLKSYQGYLEKAKAAMAEDGVWIKELQSIFKGTPLLDLQCIKASNGSLYYLNKDAKWVENSAGIFVGVVLTTDLTQTTQLRFDKGEVGKPEASPQAVLKKQALARIAELRLSEWDTAGIDIAQVVHDSSNVDPILRAILLDLAVKHVKQYGCGVEVEAAAVSRSLSIVGESPVQWLKPNDPEANALRDEAKKLLAKLGSGSALKNMKDTVARNRQAMAKGLGRQYSPFGMALKENGAWQILNAQGGLVPGQRLVVVAESVGSAGRLCEIGAIKDGKIVITDSSLAGAPEGSIVFASPGDSD